METSDTIIENYKNNWPQQVYRMNKNRLPLDGGNQY